MDSYINTSNKTLELLKVKVLIIDNQPLVVEAIRNALIVLNIEGYEINFDTACNCNKGFAKIKKLAKNNKYDIIILETNNSDLDRNIKSSNEELGKKIKGLFQNSKLIVLTYNKSDYEIYKLFQLKPDSLLIKNYINSYKLRFIFKLVIKNKNYFSREVSDIVNKFRKFDHLINDTDILILQCISKGIQTKKIPQYIPLSLTSIERRKRYLKDLFDAAGKGDEKLISEVRKIGFL